MTIYTQIIWSDHVEGPSYHEWITLDLREKYEQTTQRTRKPTLKSNLAQDQNTVLFGNRPWTVHD